ncbi:MAG TPA: hypothetical protein DEF02_03285, partial [Clostridiales bacterium]|nr:hypothetical protein [Clostridiales bacterium]
MRMRKLSLVLLLVLISVMLFGLVACNPKTDGNTDTPVIPTPTPNPDPDNSVYIGAQDFWNAFKAAALNEAGAEKDKRYIRVDTAFVMGFSKDSSDSLIVARFAGNVDTVEDSNSEILVEFRKLTSEIDGRTVDQDTICTMAKNGEGTLLFGAYYYEGKLVADMRGIKKGDGVHVVYTDTINMTDFVSRFSNALEQLDLSSILYDTLMGYDIGGLVNSLIKIDVAHLTVEQLLVNVLFGASKGTLVDYGNGHQVLRMPCDLGLIVSIIPLVQGLIPENIIGLVKDVLGLDLGKLGALAGMALYMEADIMNGALQGTTFDIDVNLNSYGVEGVEEKYGTFQSEFGIKLGYAKADFAGTPDLNLVGDENNPGLLKNRNENNTARQDGEKSLYDAVNESAEKYSFLTLDGAISLTLNFNEKKVSIDNVIGSFGTLISNLLTQNLDPEMLEALKPLFAKEIDFASGEVKLTIKLQADINTKDAKKTRLAAEILGRDGAKRVTAYYTGEKEGVYIDAGGLLGYSGTKFKIDDINVNELLGDLVDKVFETVKGAIDGLKGGATTQNIQQAFVDNGEIVIQHGAYSAAEGEGSVDVLSLVSMILDHVNVGMDENIFNIRDISVDLSRDILETIFSLVFTGDNAGADIPITGALLKYVNNGAQQNKNLTLSAELGVREYNEANTEYSLAPLIGLALGVDITFGKINNLPGFEATFEKLENELAQNEDAYLPILKNGALNTDLLHVNVSTGLTLDIETLKGELANIEVNMPDQEIGTMFKGILLKALIELGNIDGGLKLDINADIDLTGGLDTSAILDLLLKSSAKIAISKQSDNEEVLAIYLQDGWVYLEADILCISVKQIKLNVRELVDMLGTSDDPSSSHALVADETEEDGGMDVNAVLGFVAGIIDGFKLGNHALEVVLASNLFEQVLGLLNIDGVKIEFASTEFDGGIRIALNDGLNLPELQLGVFVSLGNNVNLDLSLNGLSAGLNDKATNYLLNDDRQSDDFTEILEYPFLGLDLTLGLNFTADQGARELVFGEGKYWLDSNGKYVEIEKTPVPDGYTGKLYYKDSDGIYQEENITKATLAFDEPMNLNYELRIAGQLDLSPIVEYLLGAPQINTKGNVSELMIELTGKKSSDISGQLTAERKVLLGLYYTGGSLYIDASNFGLNKVRTDIDLYEVILALLAKDSTVAVNGATGADAMAAEDTIDQNDADARKALALDILATLSSDNVKLQIAKGLTDILYQLIGIDASDITAWAQIAWASIKDKFDNKPVRIVLDANNDAGQSIGSAEIYIGTTDRGENGETLSPLKLEIGGDAVEPIRIVRDGQQMQEMASYVQSEGNVFEDVELFNDYGDVTIPGIYAEIQGTFTVGALQGNKSWTVGEWIASFLDDSNPELNSFVRQLLLTYKVPVEAGANIGFRIALNAHLNPDVPVDLTQNAVFKKYENSKLADLAKYVEVYKLSGAKYVLLTDEERTTFEGDVYVKQYVAGGIALTEVTDLNYRGEGYVLVDGNYVKVNVTDENQEQYANEKIYTAASLLDIAYIASHSDIAIEIYNEKITLVDKMSNAEKLEHVILALRLQSTGENAQGKSVSTVYLDLSNDFHLALTNIDLGALLGGLLTGGSNSDDSTATTAADESASGGIDLMGILGKVLGGIIGYIGVDTEGLQINFAEALVATLVQMLAGKQVDPEKFIKLNSDRSYLAFAWKDDYKLELNLQIDPAYVGFELSSIKLALGKEGGVLPDDFDPNVYTTAENLDTLSLNVDLGLDLQLKGQDEQVRLEKYLDLFIADLGIKLGIDMFDDIEYDIGLSLGANLALNEPNESNIVLEIKNNITNKNILAVYIEGQNIYFDFGSLGREPVYIEGTNLCDVLCKKVVELLGDLNSIVKSGASTAADEVAVNSADEKMQLILDITDGKLSVLVMQNVLVGLIAALTSNDGSTDIATIIEKLDLDISVGVDLQLDPSIAIDVNLDSNLIALGVSVGNIDVATGTKSNAYAAIREKAQKGIRGDDKFVLLTNDEKKTYEGKRYNKVGDTFVEAENGDYRGYYTEMSNAHIIEVDLSLIVDYYASATYTLVTDQRALETISPLDRYSYSSNEQRFVQDPNGTYVREGFAFDELLDLILNMDGLQSILATMLPQIRIDTDNEEIGFDVQNDKFSVGDLLKRLGLNLVLSDKMDDGFKLDIKARLNLQKIGMEDLSKIDLKNLNLDIETILNGLEAYIGIDFDYEHPGTNTKLGVYLEDGIVFVDMEGIGGPRVQVGLIDLLEKLGVTLGSSSSNSGASTAADTQDGEMSVGQILNMIVSKIVLSGTPWIGDDGVKRIDQLGVFVRANFINDLFSMLFKTVVDSENTVVDESQSGLFLYPQKKFGNYGVDEALALQLKLALANKKDPIDPETGELSSKSQYLIDLNLGLDAKVGLVSVDTNYQPLLDNDEKLEFISLDDYIENIVKLLGGFSGENYQRTTDLTDNAIYYSFEASDDGEYLLKTGMYRKPNFTVDANGAYVLGEDGEYRLINDGETLPEGTKRYAKEDLTDVQMYSRSYATVKTGEDGKQYAYIVKYDVDPNGAYVYDAENDIYVNKNDASAPESNTFYSRVDMPITVTEKDADGNEITRNALASEVKLYNKCGKTAYQDQNISLSVSGLIYFNSASAEVVNAGGLLPNAFRDMIINLQTLNAFNAGIGLRVSANIDLAALDLQGLASGGTFGDFINNSDLSKVELAIEFVEVDDKGYFAKYDTANDIGNGNEKVLGGMYLSGGTLYLDLTGLVTTAENYSKIENFVEFAKKVADKLGSIGSGKEENGAQTASDEAQTRSSQRDAVLLLAYSDSQFQIQITKALIAFVLATFMPDLGSLEDVFDVFNISLGVDLGQPVYKSVEDLKATDPDLYEKFQNEYKGDRYTKYTTEDLSQKAGTDTYYVAGNKYYLADTTYVYEAKVDSAGVTLVDGIKHKFQDGNLEAGKTYAVLENGKYVVIENKVQGKYVHSNANYYAKVENVTDPVSLRSYRMYRRTDGVESVTDTYIENDTYIRYNGEERKVEELRSRLFGYVKDENGEYYRTIDLYNQIGDYYIGLDVAIGCVNMGLKLGGIEIGFGAGEELLPAYIRDGKAHSTFVKSGELNKEIEYTDETKNVYDFEDIPTNMFYDTIITVGFSVELEFGITEGTLDFGKILSSIIGDLTGVVVEMPSTTKGYSSAHFRLDVSLMVDIYDLTKSELKLELINVTETGYESLWLGAYYVNNTIYVNLEEAFNIQKFAVGGLNIAEILKDYIIDFDSDDEYFVAGDEQTASTSEAFVASGAQASDVDLSDKELALSMLINKDLLTLKLGDKLFDTILEYIPEDLLGFDIKDLFYQEINGGLQVELNTSDSINLSVDVALGLDGDRYNKDSDYAGTDADKESLANKVNNSEIYYVFKQDANGNYVKGENGNYVRAITSKEENEVAAKDR